MNENNFTVNELIEELSTDKDSGVEFVTIKTYTSFNL